jgi:hypothetical protein
MANDVYNQFVIYRGRFELPKYPKDLTPEQTKSLNPVQLWAAYRSLGTDDSNKKEWHDICYATQKRARNYLRKKVGPVEARKITDTIFWEDVLV